VGNGSGSDVVVVFSGAPAAARLVAGVPAAARALREVAAAGASHCTIAVPGGWSPGRFAGAELHRLAGGMAFAIVDTAALSARDEPCLLVQGERPAGADRLRAALAAIALGAAPHGLLHAPPREWNRLPRLTPAEAQARLDRAGRAIVAATSKPGDGIVSQLLNRPVSQAITRLLLRLPGVTPLHATAASAALALAMLATLVFGGGAGLVLGAVLYQIASIVDGVDGEIARATFRASPAGAMADSLVDAVTNIGFLAGVVINLWIQGNAEAAIAGASGLAIMALGLFLIGRRARRSEATFTFDGVKHHFKARRSWLSQMLIWLTMRDFIALGWLVGIILGMAAPGLVLFAAGAAIWLVVVLVVLRPRFT
jgi:1L-myo-inositol 1-phosphate cytidylyltransferase / CDP-L-myo-inositol myo-inositolphosphotransferase